MNSQRLKSNLLLVLTALIWGISFVAQSEGMNYVGPFTFNCVRSIIGGLSLLPVIAVLDRKNNKNTPGEKTNVKSSSPWKNKTLIIGGICCGVALCVASSLQQIGIQYTTAGKAGFITALYIIIVPLLGLFLKKKVGLPIWLSVAVALVGMYLLCITDDFSIGRGDLLVLLCAFVFAIHILVIDHFSPRVDAVRLSCIQFLISGIICAVPMFIFEAPSISAILSAWAPVLYAGLLSCGVAYTLQIVGQKQTEPTTASLILSLESVFAALAGALLLQETLSARELIGCVLVFVAILLTQSSSFFSLQKEKKQTKRSA